VYDIGIGYHDVSIDERVLNTIVDERVLNTIVDPETQHMCSIRIE